MAVAVAALTALGFALRLAGIDQALYADELSTYAAVTLASGPGDVIHLITADQDLIDSGRYVVELTPPLSFLLAWLTSQVGDPTETVRLGSVLAGTATIPLVYLFGRRTVGRSAALVGATLVALSPFVIFYSVEARGYSLAMLLALAAGFALLRALETRATLWWGAYALASCAALYTHYTVVFVLFAQAAWALWAHREAWRPLLLANLVAGIGYLPWLPEFFDDRASGWNQLPRLHPFGLESAGQDLLEWSVQNPLVDFATVPGVVGGGLIAAGLAIAIVSLIASLGSRAAAPRRRMPPGLVLVIALAASVPVGLIAWSALGSTILDSRNMLPSWPGLALALGALLTSARRPLVGMVATGLVVAGLAVALVKNSGSEVERPDYRQAAAFVEDHTAPGDPVIDLPVLGLHTGPLSRSLAIYLPDREVQTPADLQPALAAARGDRVAVVTWFPNEFNGVPAGTPQPPEAPERLTEVASAVFQGGPSDVAVFVFENRGAAP